MMGRDKRGDFSRSLFSLQLQIQTLLEEAGGEDAAQLLDSLCSLNPSEQKIALRVFKRTLERFMKGDRRLCTKNDLTLRQFEEDLYQDIISAIDGSNACVSPRMPSGRKLEVVDGGKSVKSQDNTPIDLDEVRARRRANGSLPGKPFLN